MLLYVAGPYSAPTEDGIQANIDKASDIAAELWIMGHAVICPHKNTGNFHNVVPQLTHEQWLKGDKQMIAVCDGIVFVPGWENSPGSREELEYARSIGMTDDPTKGPITVWFYPDVPELHGTEVKSPIQVKSFRIALGRMMRTHLSKNLDYSPLNIAGPGMVGIVTRIYDKVTRLMNLIGFDIDMTYKNDGTIVVKIHPDFKPKNPQHEGLQDTLLDLSVYGIIGKLFLDEKWGR